MIGAEYIENVLYEAGIRHVFGYSGSMMLRIMDTIYQKDRITFHQMFHEQAASFAANGYARISGSIGVALVTSGPGAINVLAGIADAYLDSIPLLCITGQDNSHNVLRRNNARMNGFQDIKIADIVKPIVKYSVIIKSQKEIVYELEKAIYIANEGRKGPVLVDIPMDFQYLKMPEDIFHFAIKKKRRRLECDIGMITRRLMQAKRPLILIGGGVRLAHIGEELGEFLSRTHIDAVTTLNGIDSGIKAYGFSGLFGCLYANIAVYCADLIIALGTRLGQQQVGKSISDYTQADIIHVDIDKAELGRVFEQEIKIHEDLSSVVQALNKWRTKTQYEVPREWREKLLEWKEMYSNNRYKIKTDGGVDPIMLVKEITSSLPIDSIITADVGQNEMWTAQGIVRIGESRFLCSSGYGSMGFSLPAAIGASYANPNRDIVAFMGDGGFQMNMQELEYLKLHQINIKLIIFNNNTLGMMREVQRAHYDGKYYGSNINEFQCPNLKKIADAYNMPYYLVEKNSDLNVMEILCNTKSCIVDCRVNIDCQMKNRYDDVDRIKEASLCFR